MDYEHIGMLMSYNIFYYRLWTHLTSLRHFVLYRNFAITIYIILALWEGTYRCH